MIIKERPILFSAPMVRAILDGRKTQTRRALKCWERYADWSHAQPTLPEFREELAGADESSWLLQKEKGPLLDLLWQPVGCPYGKPGDRLWIRETFCWSGYAMDPDELLYRSDQEYTLDERGDLPWKPSIFMPRWASRITLEITDVRVERLQDISTDDAIAEGCTSAFEKGDVRGARAEFAELWESINGASSWESNPWVWVIEFKRAEQ